MSLPPHLDECTRFLREIVESLMWELDAVRQGRWEELPHLQRKKEALIERIEAFDWSAFPEDDERRVFEAQIIDLEYQIQQHIQSRLNILQLQMNDLETRSLKWKKLLNPYRQAARN